MEEKPDILELPHELLFRIFVELSIIVLIACENTSRALRVPLKDVGFWQKYNKTYDHSLSLKELKKRSLLNHFLQVAPQLLNAEEHPEIFQDIFRLHRHFKIDFNQLENGLKNINKEFEALGKRVVLQNNTHLSLIKFMRDYLSHASIPSFQQACEALVNTMNDSAGMLMIILFTQHTEECIHVFTNFCTYLNVGFDQFYVVLREYFKETSPYMGQNSEEYFSNTMLWMQTIPTCKEAEKMARNLIMDADAENNILFSYK